MRSVESVCVCLRAAVHALDVDGRAVVERGQRIGMQRRRRRRRRRQRAQHQRRKSQHLEAFFLS